MTELFLSVAFIIRICKYELMIFYRIVMTYRVIPFRCLYNKDLQVRVNNFFKDCSDRVMPILCSYNKDMQVWVNDF